MAHPDIPLPVSAMIAHVEQFPAVSIPDANDPLRWAAMPAYSLRYLLDLKTSSDEQALLCLGATAHYVLGDDENCFILMAASKDYLTSEMIVDSILGILFRLHWERSLLLQYASDLDEGIEMARAIDEVIPVIQTGSTYEAFVEVYETWKEFRSVILSILAKYPHLIQLKRGYFDELSRHNMAIYESTQQG